MSGGTASKHQFTGQEYDHATGLNYYQSRYYNAYQRRFIQPDSIIPDAYDPQQLNPYAYVRNNPVKYTDPSGNILLLAWIIADYAISLHDYHLEQKIITNPESTPEQIGAAKQAQLDILAYEVLLEPDEIAGLPILGAMDDVARGSKTLKRAAESGKDLAFSSFRKFKSSFGSAGTGNAWHHIVEQHADNVAKFSSEQIHNTNNLVKLPNEAGDVHRRITGLYNSRREELTGPGYSRVRDWIKEKDYKDQYNFGIKMITENGGQKYLDDAGLHYIE